MKRLSMVISVTRTVVVAALVTLDFAKLLRNDCYSPLGVGVSAIERPSLVPPAGRLPKLKPRGRKREEETLRGRAAEGSGLPYNLNFATIDCSCDAMAAREEEAF